jgi:NPCBM/NEW2 domain-containing protein
MQDRVWIKIATRIVGILFLGEIQITVSNTPHLKSMAARNMHFGIMKLWNPTTIGPTIAVTMLAITLPVFGQESGAKAEQLYRHKATWAQTMLASRAALKAYESNREFRSYSSPLIRGEEAPKHISVDISGLDSLLLFATDGGDGSDSDQTIWAEAKLIAADGSVILLDALEPTYVEVGSNQFRRSETRTGSPLRIGDRTFAKGLWAHAHTELRYDLENRFFNVRSLGWYQQARRQSRECPIPRARRH